MYIDGFLGNERVLLVGVMGFLFSTEQLVYPVQGGLGTKPGILNIQDLLHRGHHEPQVAEDSHHLADGQI